MEGVGIIFVLAIVGLAIVVMRFIGAWMLRIDDVIAEQKKTNVLLKEIMQQRRDIYDAERAK